MKEGELEGGILSSVVPQITELFPESCGKGDQSSRKGCGTGPEDRAEYYHGSSGSVGSDLVVDAVAAMKEYPLPLVIVDMGTATTVCVVNSKGNYIGG